ncbi:hypothetical protein BCR34DRAFT_562004 [Clohesyomyces aquaticus]|uniref:F-box domain-containing protein n=1 Tax=Clohesyomyces aquaticus TaxID=1231657 RepID=A0A1Y1ZTE5_9PLEO|nr:hypothetical protein BCR34DRAFT_562004 [Clohesyomyces aquaticus]
MIPQHPGYSLTAKQTIPSPPHLQAVRRQRRASLLMARAGLAQLPAELQISVFGYLDHADLKSVRLASRAFRDNSEQFLFDRTIACARYQALGALQKISRHDIYQKYVKEIIFDGSVYEPQAASKVRVYINKCAAEAPTLNECFDAQKHSRFQRYKTLYREQEDMKTSLVLLQSLARALECMPNITSIVYSPVPRTVPAEAADMRDILPRGELPSINTPIPIGEHPDSYIARTQHGIHHLIGAVALAQYSGIRSFTVEACKGRGTEMNHHAFDFADESHLEAGKYFFGRLQKLVLNLSLRSSARGHQATVSPNLAVLLGEAKDLQELCFHICHWKDNESAHFGYMDERSLFSSLGLRNKWPNLRTLSLKGIYAAGPEISSLITGHQDTLTKVVLNHFSLVSGTWADIVDEVITNTNIPSFILHLVNETQVGEQRFRDMAYSIRETWRYEGFLAVDGGQRRFVSRRGGRIGGYMATH